MKKYMRPDSAAIVEDMVERPKFYKFLKEIHQRACGLYGNISYELTRNLFWASLEYLSSRERNILVGHLVFNLGRSGFYKKLGIKPSTAKTVRKRAKKKLDYIIFKQLEVEKVISGITQGRTFEKTKHTVD